MTTPAQQSDLDQLLAANQRAYETVAQLDDRRPIRYWDGHNHGCGQATEEVVLRSFEILHRMAELGLPTTCEHLAYGGIDYAHWNARAAGIVQCADCARLTEEELEPHFDHCDRCEPTQYLPGQDPDQEGLPGLRVPGMFPIGRSAGMLFAVQPRAIHIRARQLRDLDDRPGPMLPPIVLRYRICGDCAQLDAETEPQPTPGGKGEG